MPADLPRHADARHAATLGRLVMARRGREDSEWQVTLAVVAARGAGVPWALIADVLGVTRQGAAKRYAQATT
jgi:hypothetical protein